ncbi:hypothetical protein EMIHUDRAFT_457487 [Emiliania huxleyi CCMP1516]|uniref:5-amino-6-(5-phosphoribosylamino)uracil reductase n=2 Tax=Emiliania huxleyi TaxID=2903 RepID=A0A0D3JQ43_EMIH1|nr:hypothetical protein EMIHUDRAFT_457487 [Emiliania huxleyi CCMP1516]EOD25628.1 hypothetical protein EMIHUDRAFT_457487 [Emiliania huxleyi CCMP1516]|eukprot:XP_005778057.1 hypothetical protein EMIHUDRAFT_457487 [Emiliania huxleyi CCMP1516]
MSNQRWDSLPAGLPCVTGCVGDVKKDAEGKWMKPCVLCPAHLGWHAKVLQARDACVPASELHSPVFSTVARFENEEQGYMYDASLPFEVNGRKLRPPPRGVWFAVTGKGYAAHAWASAAGVTHKSAITPQLPMVLSALPIFALSLYARWQPLRPAAARSPQCTMLDHEGWMQYAVQLSERGRLSTAPNPWVGCVIVGGDGGVLAEGFHERKGGPHAEAAALAAARSRGITSEQMAEACCYVTLEPCHRGPGKTTPPCDEALVASGLREIHIAVLDPDPAFGGGAAHLRENGICVGTGAKAVLASLRPYLHQRRCKAPYVVLKVASTLDGAIGCEDGTSQWITGPKARRHAQLLRASSQAILVGSGTAVVDEPRLTLRLEDEGLLPPGWAAPPKPPALSRWSDAGVDVCVVGAGRGGGVCLEEVLLELGSRGTLQLAPRVLQLMVEGGGAVIGGFLAEGTAKLASGSACGGAAQQLQLYLGATALGSTAQRWIKAPLASTKAVTHICLLTRRARHATLLSTEVLGDDVCLCYALGEGEVGGEVAASGE